MKFALIYISPNGSTRITAKKISESIIRNNNKVELIDLGSSQYREKLQLIHKKIEDANIIGFGTPVYHMDMLEPMKEYLTLMKKKGIQYKFKAFVFLNYSGITSGKTFINFAKILNNMNIPVIGGLKIKAPHVHHKDEKFPLEETDIIIKNFYTSLQNNNFNPIEQVRLKKIFSTEKIRVNLLYPFVHVIGKKRELPIKINIDQCIKCGKCIKECPAGALKLNNNIELNLNKCLHCYHCVVSCPIKAINSPIEKLDNMIKMNKKVIGVEKPFNKILM